MFPWIHILISSLVWSTVRLISQKFISCSPNPSSLFGNIKTYQSVEELPSSRPAGFSVAQIMQQNAGCPGILSQNFPSLLKKTGAQADSGHRRTSVVRVLAEVRDLLLKRDEKLNFDHSKTASLLPSLMSDVLYCYQ